MAGNHVRLRKAKMCETFPRRRHTKPRQTSLYTANRYLAAKKNKQKQTNKQTKKKTKQIVRREAT